MTASQILLASIITFIIARTIVAYKKNNLSSGFTLIWILFWLAGLTLIFHQEFAIGLAEKLSISRGVDLIIYLSLIFIFYMLYRLLVKLSELERQITKIIRKIALKEKGL